MLYTNMLHMLDVVPDAALIFTVAREPESLQRLSLHIHHCSQIPKCSLCLSVTLTGLRDGAHFIYSYKRMK